MIIAARASEMTKCFVCGGEPQGDVSGAQHARSGTQTASKSAKPMRRGSSREEMVTNVSPRLAIDAYGVDGRRVEAGAARLTLTPRSEPEPRSKCVHVAHCAEALDAVGGEARWQLATRCPVRLQRIRHERFTPDEDRAERLAVAVPQRLAKQDAPRTAREQPRQPHSSRQVEPHDEVRCVEHERAELRVVAAVDDPRLALDVRRDASAQLLGRGRRPARPVVQRIELDVRRAETRGELACERRLAVSARAREHGDASR